MSTIVDLASEHFQIEKAGATVLTTIEHDSLRIWGDKNRWWWYSRGVGGGVKEWLNYFNYSDDEKLFYLDQVDPLAVTQEDTYFEYDIFVEIGIGQKRYNNYIKNRKW